MVKVDGFNDEEIDVLIQCIFVEYIGYDVDLVMVDDDGVCWYNGNCWYVEEI